MRRAHAGSAMLRAVQFGHARAGLDEHRGVGYERRSKSTTRVPRAGVAAPSAGVKRRSARPPSRGALPRRLTRSRRAQLDGVRSCRSAEQREERLRRQRRLTGQQSAGQHTARSHGPLAERPNRSTQARTASMIASTASPSSLPAGVIGPSSGSSAPVHLVAHARRLSARPGRLSASHGPCRAGGRAGERSCDAPTPSAARRSASPITSALSRRRGTEPRGREHVCALAGRAARAARRDRAGLVSRPHHARARGPPWRERLRAGRARELAGGERGLDLIRRGDRDIQHRSSATRSRPGRSHITSRPGRGHSCCTRPQGA